VLGEPAISGDLRRTDNAKAVADQVAVAPAHLQPVLFRAGRAARATRLMVVRAVSAAGVARQTEGHSCVQYRAKKRRRYPGGSCRPHRLQAGYLADGGQSRPASFNFSRGTQQMNGRIYWAILALVIGCSEGVDGASDDSEGAGGEIAAAGAHVAAGGADKGRGGASAQPAAGAPVAELGGSDEAGGTGGETAGAPSSHEPGGAGGAGGEPSLVGDAGAHAADGGATAAQGGKSSGMGGAAARGGATASSSGGAAACECSAGACCDGCHYRPDAVLCDADVVTATSCDAPVKAPYLCGGGSYSTRINTQHQRQYCSGASATCNGRLFSAGLINEECPSGQACTDSGSGPDTASCKPCK
jgi:hypothetical protein